MTNTTRRISLWIIIIVIAIGILMIGIIGIFFYSSYFELDLSM